MNVSYTLYIVSKSVLYTLYRRYTVSPAFNTIKMAWVAGLGGTLSAPPSAKGTSKSTESESIRHF